RCKEWDRVPPAQEPSEGSGLGRVGEEPDEPGTLASVPSQTVTDPSPRLGEHYARYVHILTGRAACDLPRLNHRVDAEALAAYTERYLPHEILHWGGQVDTMFPESCRFLAEAGIDLTAFVSFWFREPRPASEPYDFFLLKVDRFEAFVRECLPAAADTAAREATLLREGYWCACEYVGS
ncbi:MAG: hypothetical protein ACREI3_01835, partial [Nitrospirales bacterium]